MINIERPEDRIPANRIAIFYLGFRPFFSLAALAAIILIALWVPYYSGHIRLNSYLGIVDWHAHEMIFGYAIAVIAGFLLAAVRNWTGHTTPEGLPLALIVLIWLLGRLVVTLDLGLPPLVIMLVDLSFIPLLMLALAPALIKGGKPRNSAFLLVLCAFFTANLLVHLQAMGITTTAALGLMLGTKLVILMIIIIGGRVIPFFTRNPLPGMQPRSWPWLELFCVAGTVLWILAGAVPGIPAVVEALLAIALGIAHATRLQGWYDRRIWGRPIIWVLHVAYAWIAIGFLLSAAAYWNGIAPQLATHAFTVGGIGLITLGMMVRVSLGHTGRMLELPKPAVWAVFILSVATLVRVVGPLLFTQHYDVIIQLSALLWMGAFALFCVSYLPMLWRPRIDGRPG